MSKRLLFISDLHLQDSTPELTAALLDFLDKNAGVTSALYVLGDLFEVWLGDDISTDLSDRVAAALRKFSELGADIFLMHGNRDFLLGEDYAERCNASLIDEPYTIENSPIGKLTLLHGDVLCTDDTDYQQFRQLVRQPQWQRDFLHKPVAERIAFAQEARAASQAATSSKSMEIMDVNPQAVIDLATQLDATLLIHGHTHRPGEHEFTTAHSLSPRQRVVLGDWGKFLWFAQCDSDGLSLKHYEIK